ncbi:hypothetical protein B0H19DRAFT_1284855 [Mycena capillaripes]|nr:hypothetical protein B0H19DRAFT_1284855 [Mycena capillaripes]
MFSHTANIVTSLSSFSHILGPKTYTMTAPSRTVASSYLVARNISPPPRTGDSRTAWSLIPPYGDDLVLNYVKPACDRVKQYRPASRLPNAKSLNCQYQDVNIQDTSRCTPQTFEQDSKISAGYCSLLMAAIPQRLETSKLKTRCPLLQLTPRSLSAKVAAVPPHFYFSATRHWRAQLPTYPAQCLSLPQSTSPRGSKHYDKRHSSAVANMLLVSPLGRPRARSCRLLSMCGVCLK